MYKLVMAIYEHAHETEKRQFNAPSSNQQYRAEILHSQLRPNSLRQAEMKFKSQKL